MQKFSRGPPCTVSKSLCITHQVLNLRSSSYERNCWFTALSPINWPTVLLVKQPTEALTDAKPDETSVTLSSAFSSVVVLYASMHHRRVQVSERSPDIDLSPRLREKRSTSSPSGTLKNAVLCVFSIRHDLRRMLLLHRLRAVPKKPCCCCAKAQLAVIGRKSSFRVTCER